MNKRQAENYTRTIDRLRDLGVSYADAQALFRIERTLSHWSEMECGDERGNAIERDEATGKPFMTHDKGDNGKRGRYSVPDRERGATNRLARIMARYPALLSYIQGDPRGCALYIVPLKLAPAATHPALVATWLDANYNQGIAVCY